MIAINISTPLQTQPTLAAHFPECGKQAESDSAMLQKEQTKMSKDLDN